MSLDNKLDSWIAAGLIDAAAADRIRAHEAREERPYAQWALIALGLLALGLGVLLIIADNWDAIPNTIKLGAHWLLTALAAVVVWHGQRADRRWLAEGALFVLGMLVLGGIALHSQVYQLTGPIWQALLMWLVLMAPALLLVGDTRLTGYVLAGLSLWLLGDLLFDREERDYLIQGISIAGPVALVGISLVPRLGRRFADGLREVGIVATLAGASIAHFAWAESVSRTDAGEMALRLIVPALVVIAAVAFGRMSTRMPRALLLPLLVGPLVAVSLAAAIPHGNGWPPRLVGALVFAAMWAWIAWSASASGWRLLFGVAIAAIAIRIFIVYFELFGTLATTGLGLVAGGALLIGLAYGWRRLFRLGGKP